MATYPILNSDGVIAQLPYMEADDFVTHVADMECGFSYTESQNEGPLKRWTIQYNCLTDPERKVLEDFFNGCNGTLGEFEFKDNQGTVHPRTRFDMNELVITYPEAGRVTITVKLLATP